MKFWTLSEREKYYKENGIVDSTVLLPDEEAFLKIFPGGFTKELLEVNGDPEEPHEYGATCDFGLLKSEMRHSE